MTTLLYIKVFLAMLHFSPVEQLPQWPGHEETSAEAMARYGAIAESITLTCQDMKAPWSCASLLVAFGAGESSFAKDTDTSPECYRGGAHRTRCDSGAAYTVWQIHAVGDVTGERLRADRRLAAATALRAARGSLTRCAHLPPGDRLAGLSGRCDPGPRHMKSARARYALWKRVEAWKP